MASNADFQSLNENNHDIRRGGFTLKSKIVSGTFVGWVMIGGELIRKHQRSVAEDYAEQMGCFMKRVGMSR